MRSASAIIARAPTFWLSVLGVLWGANFLFMKHAAGMGATRIVWLRLFFGALALAPFLPAAIRAAGRNRMLWLHLLVMTLAANIVTFHCFMEGTSRLGTGPAGVVSGAIPLMTAVLASICLPGEQLTPRKLLGLAISFGGIVTIMQPWQGVAVATASGLGYMLTGALGYAVAFVYARRFLTSTTLSPLGLAAMQMAMATVLYAPLTQWSGMSALNWDWTLLGSVMLGLGVFGSGLAYVIYYGLIEAIGAVAASAVTYLPPLVALGLGWMIGQEPPHLVKLIGAGLVLLGIAVLRGK